MFDDLVKFMKKPDLYTSTANVFWDDEHISKALLEAHLNSNIDAASRKQSFMEQSVEWITQKMPPKQYAKLLDLGCGPGLYAERFDSASYDVMGIDFSRRSIAYAKEQNLVKRSNVTYSCQNYLTIDYKEEFDIITLIYCDFGALNTGDRLTLLNKIYSALKAGGKFILDVFTTVPYMNKEESRSWEYCDKGGFWSENPYICLNSVYHYDEDNTELRQSIVQTQDNVKSYHIWEHYFTKESLLIEMQNGGFKEFELYGDISGKEYSITGENICGIFTKKQFENSKQDVHLLTNMPVLARETGTLID